MKKCIRLSVQDYFAKTILSSSTLDKNLLLQTVALYLMDKQMQVHSLQMYCSFFRNKLWNVCLMCFSLLIQSCFDHVKYFRFAFPLLCVCVFFSQYNILNQIVLLADIDDTWFWLLSSVENQCITVFSKKRVWDFSVSLCQMIPLSWFMPLNFFSFSRKYCSIIKERKGIYTNLCSECRLRPGLFMEHINSQ